jgi:hypothetical protein
MAPLATDIDVTAVPTTCAPSSPRSLPATTRPGTGPRSIAYRVALLIAFSLPGGVDPLSGEPEPVPTLEH